MSWAPHMDNLPPGLREEDYYPELRRGRQWRRHRPLLQLTEKQRLEQMEAFQRVDEWDRRRGGR